MTEMKNFLKLHLFVLCLILSLAIRNLRPLLRFCAFSLRFLGVAGFKLLRHVSEKVGGLCKFFHLASFILFSPEEDLPREK